MTDEQRLPQAILITGAAGSLGRSVSRHLISALQQGRIARLRLADIVPIPAELATAHPGVETLQLSLSTREAVSRATSGINAVIHLAGIPHETDWDALLPANLAGTAFLWDACVAAGVDRILFASSNHAVGMYPVESRLDHTAPPLADSRYGVTKAFGEQVAALYAAKTPVRAFCMRIGSCFEHATALRHLKTFQSLADFNRLVEVGLTADYRFEVVYGLSDISDGYWDNANAHRLGYAPQDRPEAFVQEPLDPTEYRLQGGGMSVMSLLPEDQLP